MRHFYLLFALTACTWTYSPQSPFKREPAALPDPQESRHTCQNGQTVFLKPQDDGSLRVRVENQSALLPRTAQGFESQRGLFQSPTLVRFQNENFELSYTDPYAKVTRLACRPSTAGE